MNLKTIGFGFAAATAIATTAALEAPAQAATLAPGSFGLKYNGPAIAAEGNFGNPVLKFSNIPFQIEEPTGAFLNITGNPIVKDVPLTFVQALSTSINLYDSPALPNFITNLFIPGDDGSSIEIAFDFNPSSFVGSYQSATRYDFAGTLSGRVRAVDGSLPEALALAGTHMIKFGVNPTRVDLDVATIPTPALLPGLISIGVAAMRKRKEAQEAEV